MNLLNKETLAMFVVAVVAVVMFTWFVYPMMPRMSENFNGEEAPMMEEVNAPEEVIAEGEEGQAPYVDAAAGTIMDGPGFERGEVEGAPETPTSIPSNYYFLDDGAGGEMSIQHNLCSPSCCSGSQWPTPFKQKYDPYVCNNKDKFVP